MLANHVSSTSILMASSITTPIQQSELSSEIKRLSFSGAEFDYKFGTRLDRRITDRLLGAIIEGLFVRFWSMISLMLSPLSLYRILGLMRLRSMVIKSSIMCLLAIRRIWRDRERSRFSRGKSWH